jgi:predicted anti-sigma-YlaC factor YlaD
VNCAAVRELMPEFALGVSPARSTSDVELHVETCAACRKEAVDLQRAVAAFGYAVGPADPPAPELEDRVVSAVRHVAVPRSRRYAVRRGGVTLLAAAIVVAAVGVGSVLANRAANRAEHSRLQVERTQLETTRMLEKFGEVVSTARFADPDTKVYLGALSATRGSGTGAALTILSQSARDQVILVLNDLPADATPLTVRLEDTKGGVIEIGSIRRLDTSGGATLAKVVRGGLDGFLEVIVRSADGGVVLRGTLAANASVSSPSP